MKKVFVNKLITAIDVGTTKIGVIIAQDLGDGNIEVLGIGKVPSEGLAKGVVVDMAKTVRSIRAALEQAQVMAKVTVDEAYIGISGAHIQSRSAFGVTPIEKGEVTERDCARAIAAARAIQLPEGQQVLHVLPQYFSIDGQESLKDPLGMHGIRLDVQIHMVTGSVASVQNLVTACERAGVRAKDVVLEQLASAAAVLNSDEMELGVGMLDIGGGTSDLALYQRGTIRHTKVFPIAGNHFTNDLAMGLRTTLRDAERIKREYGLATASLIDQDLDVEIELVQGGAKRMTTLSEITSILEPRSHELLSLVHEEIVARHVSNMLISGLVITGGGSLLTGIDYVAQDIFGVPVRVGKPHLLHAEPEVLNNPMYATGYGLLKYALNNAQLHDEGHYHAVGRLFQRMKSWVSEFF